MTMIVEKLAIVHARILGACRASGRDSRTVGLLAVSKTFPAESVQAAFYAGQNAFGENYIQEGVEKIAQLSHLPLEWHCIGPIQSNKTRLVAEHFQWVQSVDRLKIAERLSEQRPAHLPPLQVCLQVSIDGGANKSGVTPAEALALAQQVRALPRLALRGLMCIPEPTPVFIAQCALFSRARALFDALNGQGMQLDVLSLGMSADLEAAIQSGSTLVRVGSAIFGGRQSAP